MFDIAPPLYQLGSMTDPQNHPRRSEQRDLYKTTELCRKGMKSKWFGSETAAIYTWAHRWKVILIAWASPQVFSHHRSCFTTAGGNLCTRVQHSHESTLPPSNRNPGCWLSLPGNHGECWQRAENQQWKIVQVHYIHTGGGVKDMWLKARRKWHWLRGGTKMKNNLTANKASCEDDR